MIWNYFAFWTFILCIFYHSFKCLSYQSTCKIFIGGEKRSRDLSRKRCEDKQKGKLLMWSTRDSDWRLGEFINYVTRICNVHKSKISDRWRVFAIKTPSRWLYSFWRNLWIPPKIVSSIFFKSGRTHICWAENKNSIVLSIFPSTFFPFNQFSFLHRFMHKLKSYCTKITSSQVLCVCLHTLCTVIQFMQTIHLALRNYYSDRDQLTNIQLLFRTNSSIKVHLTSTVVWFDDVNEEKWMQRVAWKEENFVLFHLYLHIAHDL